MKPISDSLDKFKDVKRSSNNSTEFQMYGVYLADTLGDTKHYSLYIKMAKTMPRQILESALSYVKDYPNAKSKGKLFMWKVKEMKKELKETPKT
jgi:hypothetical protein